MVQTVDTSYMSIAELAALYRQRDVSPVEVTQHLLERGAGLQERLHAYIYQGVTDWHTRHPAL